MIIAYEPCILQIAPFGSSSLAESLLSALLSRRELLFPKVSYNAFISRYSEFYAIVFLQSGWNTAAGTTATYSIEQPLALHHSVHHPSTVALPHNLLGFLSGNLTKPFVPYLRVYFSASANDYLGHNRTIAIVKYFSAAAGAQSYTI